MCCALCARMKAKNLDDVLVYRKAVAAADEVSALLERPVFGKDLELRGQLSRSSGRVGPLIAEGFGQNTDRQMADYYGRARGSALESIGHLAKAAGKAFISSEEKLTLSNRYTEISKMLTPWINYLQRCNWKSRGIRPDDLPEGTR
jgi:four helix bundle protein